MRSKIEEIIFLYSKETEVEDSNGKQLSARRLTLEEVLKNRKNAIKALMEMPKSELVDYILGINKIVYFKKKNLQKVISYDNNRSTQQKIR